MFNLLSLADILQWEDQTSDLLDHLDVARIEFIANRLAASLAGDAANFLSPEKLQLFPNLSLTAMHRLLRSPALCQALRTNKPSVVADIIEAEIVLDQCPDEKPDRWGALGDVWLGDAPPAFASRLMSRDAFGRLAAPQVNGGIPIDLSLPLIPEFPRASLDRPESVDATLSPVALEKLNEAMALLCVISREVMSVVERMSSNFVLRTDHATASRICSATSAAAIGRTVLINVEHPFVNLTEILEALVHEAIHATVSCAELIHPLIRNDVTPTQLVRSPWTGAELHPHAFLHACLVWFGLFNFWAAAEWHGSLGGHARRRVNDIRAGFTKLNLSASRDPLQFWTPPATRQLLIEVQQRTCR